MKFTIPANKLNGSAEQFLRQSCGYAHISSRHTGKDSFVRRLTRNNYPRFHVYVMRNNQGEEIIDLHLDQKEPSYQGNRAHSGEYDGPLVTAELDRIKSLVFDQAASGKLSYSNTDFDPYKRIGHGDINKEIIPTIKKSWIKRFFGL